MAHTVYSSFCKVASLLNFQVNLKKNEDNKIQFRIFSHNFENNICNLSFGNPLDSKTIIMLQQRLESGKITRPGVSFLKFPVITGLI